MVSDADIVKHLISVLKTADLATTTTTAIRQQLEQDLRVDLSDKKAFIRQQVDLYLQHQHSQKEEENEREDGEGEQQQQEEENEEESEENEDDAEEEQDEDDYVKQVTRGVSDSKQQQQRLRHAKIRRSSKESLPKEKKKRTGGAGGLNKLCSLSPELQAVVGETELPRTQVVKQLWAYIRENGLQDPENKRKIICNEELRNLFGIDSTDMFKMNKLLSKHIWPLENGSSVVASTDNVEPRPKKPKLEKSEGARGRSSGFLAPIPISEGLAKFLGAEDGKVSRADAVKRIWDYIKENNLQDPANKKMIVCDSKLQELFELGISAVQKQQEKLQNGAQLPGRDIAQNSDLGGAESGTCGIKAIIAQRKPQGLDGLLGDPPKDVVQTDASAVWHKISWYELTNGREMINLIMSHSIHFNNHP